MCIRCEELEEELLQIKNAVFATNLYVSDDLKLTEQQRRMLRCLLRYERCSDEILFLASRGRGSKTECGSQSLVGALVHHLRKKLRPHGLVIYSIWGFGYALSPASRAKLLNWNQHQREAA